MIINLSYYLSKNYTRQEESVKPDNDEEAEILERKYVYNVSKKTIFKEFINTWNYVSAIVEIFCL